jgi:hypothetical protein
MGQMAASIYVVNRLKEIIKVREQLLADILKA